MNHAFKMIAVVLALGVLVLQGCQTSGSKDNKTVIGFNQNKKNNIDITTATCALMPSMMSCRFYRKSGIEICESIIGFKRGVETYDNYYGSLKEAERRGLVCGIESSKKTVIASKQKTKTYIQPKSTISSAELNASKRELKLRNKSVLN